MVIITVTVWWKGVTAMIQRSTYSTYNVRTSLAEHARTHRVNPHFGLEKVSRVDRRPTRHQVCRIQAVAIIERRRSNEASRAGIVCPHCVARLLLQRVDLGRWGARAGFRHHLVPWVWDREGEVGGGGGSELMFKKGYARKRCSDPLPRLSLLPPCPTSRTEQSLQPPHY